MRGDDALLARCGVLVVGSVNVDVVANAERLPGPGETVLGATLHEGGGGKGANAAVAAARLGAPVWLVAAVGDDARGEHEREAMAREGVDLQHVATLAGHATGVALIVVDEAGENQIAVTSGANAGLTADHVTEAFEACSDDVDVVLVGFEIPDEPIAEAVCLAAERGLRCIVNPAPARRSALALAGWHPVMTPNAGEAAALTGHAAPATAAGALATRTAAPVVVTLGRDGVVVAEPGVESPWRMPARTAVAHDTTGAGDTFNAALAVRLAADDALPAAIDYAMAAAALAVGTPGARGGMPDDAGVRAELNR